MAKTCAPFSSSPNFGFLADGFDLDELYASDIGIGSTINADTPFFSSIQNSIDQMESDASWTLFDEFDFEDTKEDLLRNNDLMWSTGQSALGTSSTSTLSDSVGSAAVPLAEVTCGGRSNEPASIVNCSSVLRQQMQKKQQQQQQAPFVVVANANANANKQQKQKMLPIPIDAIKTEIKQEIDDDYEQQLQLHSIPTNSKTTAITTTVQQSMQHIPPGTSLLRKSNNNNSVNKKQTKCNVGANIMQIPKMDTGEFVRERDQLLSSNKINNTGYLRPDTPHSLDDEANASMLVEFKSKIDLRACVMGSNNISLCDPDTYINQVSRELQDTNKTKVETCINTNYCFDDVLDLIKCDDGQIEDYEEDEQDDDEDDEDLHYTTASPVPSQSSSSNSSSSNSSHLHQHQFRHQQPYMLHSDHSYTRSKDGMDDLGPNLDTPSDSEEEIDVVSIDKKLPTNPSDKDRRVLQTKVAHKFSNARVVKTANGIRTIPPRRRMPNYELPYTPASSSPVKSVAHSRYPSPASTPYQNQYTSKYVQQQQQHMLTKLPDGSMLLTAVNNNTSSGTIDKTRKRVMLNASNGLEYAASKKNRSKKSKQSVAAANAAAAAAATAALKRNYSSDETADSIEKRHLHNDMERQRRIGLKNLFDALKKQIPSIKDKERAPKVNILREAAKLCENLTRDEQQLAEQKARLKEQQRKLVEKLARMRAMQVDG